MKSTQRLAETYRDERCQANVIVYNPPDASVTVVLYGEASERRLNHSRFPSIGPLEQPREILARLSSRLLLEEGRQHQADDIREQLAALCIGQ